MRSNPVLLEGFSLLEKKMIGRILVVLYVFIYSILLLIFLSDASGNIMSPDFNPPDLFMSMSTLGQISSSILLLFWYSILSFRAEETLNWIKHGRLNIRQVFAGRFLMSLFFVFIIVIISIPWFIYAARVSAVPDSIAIGAIFFNGIAVFTYSQVWILGGFIFNKNRVAQTIFIWIYIFIYLLISAKIFPDINPILILHSLNNNLLNNLGINKVLQQIYPVLYINLFLFLSTLAAAFVLWARKVRIDE